MGLALATLVAACRTQASRADADAAPAPRVAASDASAGNKAFEAIPLGTPYIPPQCYTKTKDEDGRVHNPCFTCHADALPPNYTADSSLQLAYEFGPASRVNPWTNLYVDRRSAIARISNDEIATWVRHDNYRALPERLRTTPAWDRDGDGEWSGWMPDVAFQFDEAGFDHTKDGAYTGWRAYAYFPVPGGFWPTNGSFGDAMIRLPEAFREDAPGHFDLRVYKVNLATVEALIARRDVPIEPTDEKALGQDLDGDGKLGEARVLKYRWKPGDGSMRWVGRAMAQQNADAVHLAAGLFPEGTEFAHSLRYLDVQDGRVRMAPRMKELRYMKKEVWVTYDRLELIASSEAAEKDESPTKKRPTLASSERGIGNRAGWSIHGFIEDAEGELRPQTAEEHGFCIGCHSGSASPTTASSRSVASRRPLRSSAAGRIRRSAICRTSASLCGPTDAANTPTTSSRTAPATSSAPTMNCSRVFSTVTASSIRGKPFVSRPT
ncbi:hypothetical protein AKJ09_04019 [Labilithrix luteola]|uniref:Uncharacterized protein n=1 Tax=Labilithrix luteola TaxID=1391654 RepID=A0A0K1PV01_9BACT|nr:hypothetical protein [Labilithrix luteola]AKU97355.1 hypothetical protein AKJ09_04019 [Labilithrix luteola]